MIRLVEHRLNNHFSSVVNKTELSIDHYSSQSLCEGFGVIKSWIEGHFPSFVYVAMLVTYSDGRQSFIEITSPLEPRFDNQLSISVYKAIVPDDRELEWM